MIRNRDQLFELQRRSRAAPPQDPWIQIGSGGAKAGTEVPYLYSATQVEHDGGGDFSASHWAAVAGGDVMDWNLINLAELSASAAGLGPLDVDAIVSYWSRGSGFACEVAAARGTY